MREITQYNINTREHEIVSGARSDLPISFCTNGGRYDVKINSDGSLNIYYISKLGFDRLSIMPTSANVVNIGPLQPGRGEK